MPYNSIISRTDAADLIPTETSLEIIKEIPQSSVVMQFGRPLPNLSRKQRRIPVVSLLPTAYFVAPGAGAETDIKQTTEQNWSGVDLVAEELAVIVPIPEAVLDDSEFDMWGEVKPSLVEAFGIAFDRAVLYGTNAPNSWPDDLLTQATAAGNILALGAGGVDLYDDLLGVSGVIAKLEADGYIPSGHIAATSMRGKLRGTRDAQGQPIFKPAGGNGAKFAYELDGAPITFPTNGAVAPATSLLISGDWQRLRYALRQDITFKVLTEAVIQDGTGAIIYNLAQQDMVALRAVLRVGWVLPNPVNRIEPTAANRCAFAFLTP
jgi:HK97 family phage major capsid protein